MKLFLVFSVALLVLLVTLDSRQSGTTQSAVPSQAPTTSNLTEPLEETRFRQSVQTTATVAPRANTSQFACDGRQYCSEMNSRAEAEYFTRYCPDVKMDGDGDGIPCENDSRW